MFLGVSSLGFVERGIGIGRDPIEIERGRGGCEASDASVSRERGDSRGRPWAYGFASYTYHMGKDSGCQDEHVHFYDQTKTPLAERSYHSTWGEYSLISRACGKCISHHISPVRVRRVRGYSKAIAFILESTSNRCASIISSSCKRGLNSLNALRNFSLACGSISSG